MHIYVYYRNWNLAHKYLAEKTVDKFYKTGIEQMWRAKPKGSICLLYKWVDTAFSLSLLSPPVYLPFTFEGPYMRLYWARILVQVTINRRLLIGRDGHLDQSEAYDLS